MEVRSRRETPERLKQVKPNLTGIPMQMKLDFESRSGLSFDDVRVHYSSDKPARLGALAYTQGTQVYIGRGQERCLPHELGHVVQQKSGMVRSTRTIGGLPVNDDPTLEAGADRIAAGFSMPFGTKGTGFGAAAQLCSDSEDDELTDFKSEDDLTDNFNASTFSSSSTKTLHVSPGHLIPAPKSQDQLTADATALHELLKGRAKGGTTVVCARYRAKSGFLHLATTNSALPPKALRGPAEKQGYVLLRGTKTHAEANMIMYQNKHRSNLKLVAFGCDKPSCPECDEQLQEGGYSDLSYETRPPKKSGHPRYSGTYHFPAEGSRGDGANTRRIRDVRNRHYGEDGHFMDVERRF